MKRIKIEKWNVKDTDGNNVQESLINVLQLSIDLIPPEKMPRGIEGFKTYTRIVKMFDDANKDGELIMEDADYLFFKNALVSNIPASLGMNANIAKVVREFIEL